ncbi:hypothetical protein MYAM1_003828 [Malassezia yamatoensis]|uniref:Uncharacterized protein n=1 Tax=Malassezia yamatoensis TaxID=253288 RepID=A0AAJ6CKT4_9BASI|nr:hypothetical protein MYAM1_003828 [Malassezia yamatoensis]
MASSRPGMLIDVDKKADSIHDHQDVEQCPSSTASTRSRLSLTEVYERIREEEAKEYQRKQQEHQSRKEKWREGHQAVSDTYRRKSAAFNKPQLSSQDLSDLESIDAQDRTGADKQHAQETISSVEDKLFQRIASLPENDPRPASSTERSTSPLEMKDAAASSTPHSSTPPPTLEPGIETGSSLQAYELKTILHVLKKTLNQHSPDLNDISSDDASVADMLRVIQADLRGLPIDTKHAVTSSKGVVDALAIGPNLENIFKEDAQYATRLDALRSRLGVLATELGSPKDIPHAKQSERLEKNRVNHLFGLNATIFRSPPFKWVFCITLALVLITALAVHILQSYADHLAMYTYLDPFYPQIYPVPELCMKLLPQNVRYNVPFTAHYQRSIAHLLIPTSEDFRM